MIDAKTAREMANHNMLLLIERQIKDISNQIEEAVQNGVFEVLYYEYINDKLIKKLKGLGYKVEDLSSQECGTLYQIRW